MTREQNTEANSSGLPPPTKHWHDFQIDAWFYRGGANDLVTGFVNFCLLPGIKKDIYSYKSNNPNKEPHDFNHAEYLQSATCW